MQIEILTNNMGYQLRLEAKELKKWANRPNAQWPCSVLANFGLELCVSVDKNGLYDVWPDILMERVPSDELCACINDHLPKVVRHLWPCWEKQQ